MPQFAHSKVNTWLPGVPESWYTMVEPFAARPKRSLFRAAMTLFVAPVLSAVYELVGKAPIDTKPFAFTPAEV